MAAHPTDDTRRADLRRAVQDIDHAAREGRLNDLLPSLRRIDGSDRSGTVSCVVDLAGHFEDVHVSAAWRERPGAGGLGAAVLEALEQARTKAGIVALSLRRHRVATGASSEPAGRPRPAGTSPEPVEAVLARIEETRRTLDAAARRLDDLDPAREHRRSSPNRLLHATVRGGRIVRLDVDATGPVAPAPDVVAREARALFAQTAEAGVR